MVVEALNSSITTRLAAAAIMLAKSMQKPGPPEMVNRAFAHRSGLLDP
ncbi:hypothetical protein [Arthrobacter psychrolactophilus]